jgi:hypothetical protein
LGVGIHQNAILAFDEGMNCGVGRVNLYRCLVTLQNVVSDETLSDLNLNVRAREVRDLRGGPIRHTQNICVVELKFSAGSVSGGNAVVDRNGSVHRNGDPLAVVTALRRNVSTDEADACNAGLILICLIGLLIILVVGRLTILTVALIVLLIRWRRSLVLGARGQPYE